MHGYCFAGVWSLEGLLLGGLLLEGLLDEEVDVLYSDVMIVK